MKERKRGKQKIEKKKKGQIRFLICHKFCQRQKKIYDFFDRMGLRSQRNIIRVSKISIGFRNSPIESIFAVGGLESYSLAGPPADLFLCIFQKSKKPPETTRPEALLRSICDEEEKYRCVVDGVFFHRVENLTREEIVLVNSEAAIAYVRRVCNHAALP